MKSKTNIALIYWAVWGSILGVLVYVNFQGFLDGTQTKPGEGIFWTVLFALFVVVNWLRVKNEFENPSLTSPTGEENERFWAKSPSAGYINDRFPGDKDYIASFHED